MRHAQTSEIVNFQMDYNTLVYCRAPERGPLTNFNDLFPLCV